MKDRVLSGLIFPTLNVAKNMYLFASTQLIGAASMLLVYRSLIIKPGHPTYRKVEEFLSRHEHELLCEGVCADTDMYFGTAVMSSYLVQPEVISVREPQRLSA